MFQDDFTYTEEEIDPAGLKKFLKLMSNDAKDGLDLAEFREFETGATRDLDNHKYDYEGFISPLVIREYGRFMHDNRFQKDGSIRDSDNWQKGIPFSAYTKSLIRHTLDVWTINRGHKVKDFEDKEVDIKDALCAVIFNASGMLHTLMLLEEIKDED